MSLFAGRTAIITGGGGGVGAAIARALAREGASLCLIGRRLARLQEVAAEAQAFGVSATSYQADLANTEELVRLTPRLVAEVDNIDVLVHSAGFLQRGSLEQASLTDFDNHYHINVRAPYALTQALLPKLRLQLGEIVFVNSSSGVTAKALTSQYDLTKHALKAVADSLRAEVNPHGVRVLSVYLGRTASEMQAKLHAQEGKAYRPDLLLQPEDAAAIVMSALSLPRTAEVTDIHIRPMIKS